MKKALHTLLAVCALATVARAQLNKTEWQIQDFQFPNRTLINRDAGSMADYHAESAFALTAGNNGTSSPSGVTLPAVAFRHTILKTATATEPTGGSAIGIETPARDPVWFETTEPLKDDAIGGWLHESGQGARIHEVIDSLVIGAMTEIEPHDGGTNAAAASDARTAPEPASFALFGVMALLGIVVAQKWTAVR